MADPGAVPAHGGYSSGHAFVSGLTSAVWVGAAAVAVAAGAALLLPRLRSAPASAWAARPSAAGPAPELELVR
jgi:hypothetical protein